MQSMHYPFFLERNIVYIVNIGSLSYFYKHEALTVWLFRCLVYLVNIYIELVVACSRTGGISRWSTITLFPFVVSSILRTVNVRDRRRQCMYTKICLHFKWDVQSSDSSINYGKMSENAVFLSFISHICVAFNSL